VARCVSCGTELHPERAEKYDYCMDADCRAKNARSLTIAAVGVNKAVDRSVILDEHAEEEMARVATRMRDASLRCLKRSLGHPGNRPTRPQPPLRCGGAPTSGRNRGQRPSRTLRSPSTSRGGKR
jgi:hypothetical protein